MSHMIMRAFLVTVLACLSLPTATVARIDLSSFFKSVAPVSSEGDAPVARTTETPLSSSNGGVSIGGLYGCYFDGSQLFYIQCGLGQSITILGSGFTSAASVTIDTFACTDVVLTSVPSLTCTLPTSVPADRLGVQLIVNVTVGSETASYYGRVTLLAQPILPTIVNITGCLGGIGGSAVTACRTDSQLTLHGRGLYMAPAGVVVTLGSYRCTNVWGTYANTVTCYIPDVAPADLGQPLAVTVTLDAYTASYAAPLTTWGKLAVNSVTGCDISSPPFPRNCRAGDTITITGTGFNLGPQGDANDLKVTVGGQYCTTMTVVSNTAISCVLPPAKDVRADVYVTTTVEPVVSAFNFPLYYVDELLIASTGGSVRGCSLGLKPYSFIPSCSPGDVLCITLSNVGGTGPPVDSVNLVDSAVWPYGYYPCGSVAYNGTVIQCTVPSVRSSLLNFTFGVQLSAAGVTGSDLPQRCDRPSARITVVSRLRSAARKGGQK